MPANSLRNCAGGNGRWGRWPLPRCSCSSSSSSYSSYLLPLPSSLCPRPFLPPLPPIATSFGLYVFVPSFWKRFWLLRFMCLYHKSFWFLMSGSLHVFVWSFMNLNWMQLKYFVEFVPSLRNVFGFCVSWCFLFLYVSFVFMNLNWMQLKYFVEFVPSLRNVFGFCVSWCFLFLYVSFVFMNLNWMQLKYFVEFVPSLRNVFGFCVSWCFLFLYVSFVFSMFFMSGLFHVFDDYSVSLLWAIKAPKHDMLIQNCWSTIIKKLL